MNDGNDSPSRRSPSRRRLRWLWVWGPTLAWMLAIFIGTSIPDSGNTRKSGSDKVQHFLAYAGLAILARRSWRLNGTSAQPRLGLSKATLFTAGGWAIFDELHQILIPTRDFELLDLAADALGILAGLILMTYWQPGRREPTDTD